MPKLTIDTVKLEVKSLPILSKDIGEDRVVKSLFAVMGHVDSYGDRIMPKAFLKTIKEGADRIRVLWQHDFTAPPVGTPVTLKELKRDEMPADILKQYPDATGALYGEVRYLDTPRGQEILSGIREGAIRENSIGYDAVRSKFVENTDTDGQKGSVRELEEIRLWDISPVNWGAQSAALNLKSALASLLPGYKGNMPDEQYALLDQLVTTVQDALSAQALKAGRVLSARNLEKLRAALDVLTEILLSAEPQDENSLALTEQIMNRLAIAEREIYLVGG